MGRIITLSMAVLMTIGETIVVLSVPRFNEWLDSRANHHNAIMANGSVETLHEIAQWQAAQRAKYIDDNERERLDGQRRNSYFLLR